MSAKNGWGFTKLPTRQRTKPKLHYFNGNRSLCHGTAAVGKVSDTCIFNIACPTCIAKKRALDNKKIKRTRSGRKETEALRGS